MTGRITRLARSRNCGFIRAPKGREVFFHATDVQGAKYDDLQDGLAVRFTLIDDQVSGPRAVEVRIDRRVAGAAPGSAGRARMSKSPDDR
ncbi:MAG TPA: cold shock domain-containing protein [Vicinamibacterales bacterium]|nr:cold shock domain-containing protein [Vicinamibacterales bacterium]